MTGPAGMPGFLATLAARAVGEAPALRPRPIQRFESMVDDAVEFAEPAPTAAATQVSQPPAQRQPVDGETHPLADSHARTPDSVATRPDRAALAPEPLRARETAASGNEAAQVARSARDVAREAVARWAATPPRDDSDTQATHQPEQSAQLSEPPPPAQASTQPPTPAAAGDPAAPGAPIPQPPPAPDQGTRRARTESAVPHARPPEPVGRAPSSSQHPRSTPRRPAAAPSVDLAALLRDEVFAALVERGDVPTGERAVVEAGRGSHPPRPGTAAVRAEGVRGPGSADGGPPPGEMHVHIDRVVVTRARPEPATPARPARLPVVDHDAYLARRRGRS